MQNDSGGTGSYQRFGKRILDLTLLVPALVLVAPAVVLIGLIVRLKDGPPVLFKQTRPGLKARPFVMYKFRTMREEFDPTGRPLPDGERMTRLGAWLRRTSVDELPELWNVLRGEMSLVGPRPLLIEYLERFSPRQSKRHDVPPGVTGWAQINGRNAKDWSTKLEFDVWYADHVALCLDLKILLVTIWKVIIGEGISAPGHATMPRFEENGAESKPNAERVDATD